MQLGSVELPDQYSSVCEDLPSPDKRHSWVWTGEASGKKVGEEFRTVLVRTQHASSVEVLKRDRSGDKESFDLVIMGPQWEPEEPGLKYSSDLASPDHASHASLASADEVNTLVITLANEVLHLSIMGLAPDDIACIGSWRSNLFGDVSPFPGGGK